MYRSSKESLLLIAGGTGERNRGYRVVNWFVWDGFRAKGPNRVAYYVYWLDVTGSFRCDAQGPKHSNWREGLD